MSERIVDEQFAGELAECRVPHEPDGDRFARIEQLIEKSHKEILRSPRGPLVSSLKRILYFLIKPALAPFIRHQRAVQLLELDLLRELRDEQRSRIDDIRERLLQAYVKTGEAMAILRHDVLQHLERCIESSRSGLADALLSDARAIGEDLDNRMRREMGRWATDLVSCSDLLLSRLEAETEMLRHDLERHVSVSSKTAHECLQELDSLREQAATIGRRIDFQARELASLTTEGSPAPPATAADEPGLERGEYAACHQDRFRGSEAEIARRQRLYVEHFRDSAPVLDVGCGRGEFLALLKAEGIAASGVDINERMVGTCLEKGLQARQADLLAYLDGLEPGSLGGVFAAQVVEHLDGPRIRRLFHLAFRTLRDGGIFIAETINPESVFALTRFYFLDDTHKAPLPPALLKFFAETAGFTSVEIRYLSEVPEAERLRPLELEFAAPAALEAAFRRLNGEIERLNRFLFGFAEYAVVAER